MSHSTLCHDDGGLSVTLSLCHCVSTRTQWQSQSHVTHCVTQSNTASHILWPCHCATVTGTLCVHSHTVNPQMGVRDCALGQNDAVTVTHSCVAVKMIRRCHCVSLRNESMSITLSRTLHHTTVTAVTVSGGCLCLSLRALTQRRSHSRTVTHCVAHCVVDLTTTEV